MQEALGFSETAIKTWRGLPGAPTEPDKAAWLEFIEANGLGVGGNRVSEDREHWLTQQAEYRAKLLKIEHQKADGEIVMKTDLDKRDQRIASRQKAALYEALTGELPVRAEGKTATEIREMNREAADRICQIMQRGLVEWTEAANEE